MSYVGFSSQVVAQIKRRWQFMFFRTRANSYTATTVSVRQVSHCLLFARCTSHSPTHRNLQNLILIYMRRNNSGRLLAFYIQYRSRADVSSLVSNRAGRGQVATCCRRTCATIIPKRQTCPSCPAPPLEGDYGRITCGPRANAFRPGQL